MDRAATRLADVTADTSDDRSGVAAAACTMSDVGMPTLEGTRTLSITCAIPLLQPTLAVTTVASTGEPALARMVTVVPSLNADSTGVQVEQSVVSATPVGGIAVELTTAPSTWYVSVLVSAARLVARALVSQSTSGAGMAAKPAFRGPNAVKVPGPLSVPDRPASVSREVSVVRPVAFTVAKIDCWPDTAACR